MQYVPQLPHPSRAIAVPLAAAALGAGLAAGTFAVVNIEDNPSVSLQAPAAQSVVPSGTAVAERTDGGPQEGVAQLNITQSELRGSKAFATAPATVSGGGPDESSTAAAVSESAEGSSGAQAFSGARP